MTAAVTPTGIPAPAAPACASTTQVGRSNRARPAPPTLDDAWQDGPPFRLVLPRDKRDRLTERAAGLRRLRACSVGGCAVEGMPVLLVESELEGVLCPVHQLVLLDGSPVLGQPMLATAVW